MFCPSCGRETPQQATCAQCGATLNPAQRLPLNLFKWGSLLLALAGVTALIISASRTAVPQVTLGQLNATANLAYVRVSGTVSTTPRYDSATNFLSFHLDDGTGDLIVNSYRAETQSLITNNQLPQLGDRLTLEGTLRLREDSASLTLTAPQRLVREHPTPTERLIGSLTSEDELTLVLIRGQIVDQREPFPGLNVLVIADPSGQIDATLPLETVTLTGPLPDLSSGDLVQLSGIITLYRNRPQLTLTSTQNILKLEPGSIIFPTPAPTPSPLPPALVTINQLSLAYIGATVSLEGTIQSSEDFTKGKRFTLTDNTSTITLLLWQDLFDELPFKDQLQPSAKLRVTGQIEEFNGQLEIIPTTTSDLTLIP